MRKGSLPLFIVVALGGAWLVNVPTWLSGKGLHAPMFTISALVMMFFPSIAVLAVWLVARRRGATAGDLARGTGLTLGPRWRRTLVIAGATWIGVPVLVALSLLASAAAGFYDLDFGLGLFRESLHHMPGGKTGMSAETVALISLAALAAAPVLNAIPCFGEEWGWRGWLMPRLLTYGRLRAILVSGAIWGIWHAPLTLLGYNYEALGPWAAALFIPFCVLYGAVLSWTRLATGSIWPAVIGHGALNSSATLVVLGAAAGASPNQVLAGPVSVVTMAMLAILAVVLFARVPVRTGVCTEEESTGAAGEFHPATGSTSA